jgi:heat shock protein HtpX
MLQTRLWIVMAVFFAIMYAFATMIGTMIGITNFYFYVFLAVGMMLFQYWIGPMIVEWTMGVRYVSAQDYPKLHQMVRDLAQRAGIPMPKVGISALSIPNAFAFGRSYSDGRICFTRGIMDLLNEEELRAVVGHELTHIKSRDVLTITLLSVVPMLLYRLAWSMMFYGNRRDSRDGPSGVVIGMVAFLFYFITNLLVLYVSRIREYYADEGSVRLGNRPEKLATSLYKLVYGSARMHPETLKEAEGMKAFFVNDPSQARAEIRDLAQLDLDRSGTIDANELRALREGKVVVNMADRMMEIFGTHPNMLARIKRLSELAKS